VSGAWNDATLVSPLSVTGGQKYWLALLAPTGTVAFRDDSNHGGLVQTAGPGLVTLPATWLTLKSYPDGPGSFYGS
jgi:hypothetical protein